MYIDFFFFSFRFHAAADARDENIIKQEESRVEDFRNPSSEKFTLAQAY